MLSVNHTGYGVEKAERNRPKSSKSAVNFLEMALWEFRGLTPYVGAALVVALVRAGTRPASTIRSPREIPKTATFI